MQPTQSQQILIQPHSMVVQPENVVYQPAGLRGGYVTRDGFAYANHPTTTSSECIVRGGTILGAFQMAAGILTICLNAAVVILREDMHFSSHGVWGGILFVISGSIGISAVKMKSKSMSIVFMVLSIISAFIAAACCMTFASIGLQIDVKLHSNSNSSGDIRSLKYIIGLEISLIIISFFEMVVAIISSACVCAATCCQGPNTSDPPVRYMAPGTRRMVIQQGTNTVQTGELGPVFQYASSAMSSQQGDTTPEFTRSHHFDYDQSGGQAQPAELPLATVTCTEDPLSQKCQATDMF